MLPEKLDDSYDEIEDEERLLSDPGGEDVSPPDMIVQNKRKHLNFREKPEKNKHFRVGLYIRYFNQTKYEDYLDYHKKALLQEMELYPNWTVVGFYIDYGQTAPNMENAPEWSRLLHDCEEGKVDLIITQKVSDVSRKEFEIAFCSRLLASLEHPVGIYFIAEEIYTLSPRNMEDLRDTWFSEGTEPIEQWALTHQDLINRLLTDGGT
jgi:hypothetical protein